MPEDGGIDAEVCQADIRVQNIQIKLGGREIRGDGGIEFVCLLIGGLERIGSRQIAGLIHDQDALIQGQGAAAQHRGGGAGVSALIHGVKAVIIIVMRSFHSVVRIARRALDGGQQVTQYSPILRAVEPVALQVKFCVCFPV